MKRDTIDLWSSPYVIHTSSDATIGDIDAYLSKIAADDARSASAIVLVVSEGLFARVSTNEAVEYIRRRVPTSPVFFLTFDRAFARHRLRSLEGELEPSVERAGTANIRSHDLSRILADAAHFCYFQRSSHFHFVAPSGRHCGTFVRVGDAIRSKVVLDVLGYWLLPVISTADAVLGDTWSVSPVLLRALQLCESTAHLECFPTHPTTDPVAARDMVASIASRLRTGQRLAVVSSVIGSGELNSATARFVTELLPRDVVTTYTALYGIGASAADDGVMCHVTGTDDAFEATAECQMCADGSEPLRIDPVLYYVKHVDERGVPLQERHFGPSRDIIGRLGSVPDALSVHRDHTNDTRHHAFHVDVDRLAGAGFFTEPLRAAADAMPIRPDCVLSPTHAAGQMLARIVGESLRIPTIAVDNLDAFDQLSSEAAALRASRSLLVVDDVMITGSRMARFNDALRRLFAPFEAVSFVAAVDRTPGQLAWNRLRTGLEKHAPWRASLHALATLHLPNWGAEECPWCREYDWLAHIYATLSDPPHWIDERMEQLTRRQEGIRRSPLLNIVPGLEVQSGAGALAGGGRTEIQTVFGVSAALQALREDAEKNRLYPMYPVYQVFAPRNFTNYSEPLIRGALFRCLRPRELGSRSQRELLGQLKEYSSQPEQVCTMSEMLLAAGRGVIDRDVILSLKPKLDTRIGPLTSYF